MGRRDVGESLSPPDVGEEVGNPEAAPVGREGSRAATADGGPAADCAPAADGAPAVSWVENLSCCPASAGSSNLKIGGELRQFYWREDPRRTAKGASIGLVLMTYNQDGSGVDFLATEWDMAFFRLNEAY